VDPAFRETFRAAPATPGYDRLVDALPAAFVGDPHTLRRIVALVTAQAARSYEAQVSWAARSSPPSRGARRPRGPVRPPPCLGPLAPSPTPPRLTPPRLTRPPPPRAPAPTQGLTTPPWRRYSAMMARWVPPRSRYTDTPVTPPASPLKRLDSGQAVALALAEAGAAARGAAQRLSRAGAGAGAPEPARVVRGFELPLAVAVAAL
jgi:hypothetical protein